MDTCSRWPLSHYMPLTSCVPLTSCHKAPDTWCLKIREIPTVSKFDEIRRGSWISRDNSNGEVRFVIRDLAKILDFDRNYHFTIFQKIRIFPGFTHLLWTSCFKNIQKDGTSKKCHCMKIHKMLVHKRMLMKNVILYIS